MNQDDWLVSIVTEDPSLVLSVMPHALDNEILLVKIFSFLATMDLSGMRLVCKLWKATAERVLSLPTYLSDQYLRRWGEFVQSENNEGMIITS